MELFPLILSTRVFTLSQMLLCCFALYIAVRVILPRHSQTLYGELSFLFSPVEQLHSDQIYFGPLPTSKKSTIETTSMESPSMPEIVSDRSMMVQVECLHTVLIPKALYRPTMRCRQMCRPSHISKALGGVFFCYGAKF